MLLGRFSPQAYALLRIMTGLLFFLHGTQKLLGWPPMKGMNGPLPTIAIVAGVIEIVTGAAITLGLFADWAAFIASGEMAIGYFIGHVMPSHDIVPITNRGEPAYLLCFVFLFMAAHGSGIWSIDAAMRRGGRFT
jgi:putative oxidoreductase